MGNKEREKDEERKRTTSIINAHCISVANHAIVVEDHRNYQRLSHLGSARLGHNLNRAGHFDDGLLIDHKSLLFLSSNLFRLDTAHSIFLMWCCCLSECNPIVGSLSHLQRYLTRSHSLEGIWEDFEMLKSSININSPSLPVAATGLDWTRSCTHGLSTLLLRFQIQ